MSKQLEIRNMVRLEVDELVQWAANEGWNPGLHDADIFWETDPDAFIAAELEGEMIGGGAITSYNGEFGFMGFFIIRPEYRGQGFGNSLWHARLQRLVKRLHSNATIGLDGVFDMQNYYAKGGFVFSHRNMRFRTEISDSHLDQLQSDENILALSAVSIEQVFDYDRTCFPAERQNFLQAWVKQSDSLALGYRDQGLLKGYGIIRKCREGCKIGPLFADNKFIASTLYEHLANFAVGGPLFLDAPENNPAALDLVAQYNMEEVFGCARMYRGDPPDLVHGRIFGVTTFELG